MWQQVGRHWFISCNREARLLAADRPVTICGVGRFLEHRRTARIALVLNKQTGKEGVPGAYQTQMETSRFRIERCPTDSRKP